MLFGRKLLIIDIDFNPMKGHALVEMRRILSLSMLLTIATIVYGAGNVQPDTEKLRQQFYMEVRESKQCGVDSDCVLLPASHCLNVCGVVAVHKLSVDRLQSIINAFAASYAQESEFTYVPCPKPACWGPASAACVDGMCKAISPPKRTD